MDELAILIWNKGIEEKIKAKYEKRIDHLVGCNNELIQELEQYETAWGQVESFKKILTKTAENDSRTV